MSVAAPPQPPARDEDPEIRSTVMAGRRSPVGVVVRWVLLVLAVIVALLPFL